MRKLFDKTLAYADVPAGFWESHWIYNFARKPYENFETETTKREVTNTWGGYVYWHWMYNCGGANGNSERPIYNQSGVAPATGFGYQYFGAFTSSRGDYYSDTWYCNNLGMQNFVIPEITANADCQGSTRWFRFDYYVSSYFDFYKMFQYQKIEDLESPTEVFASDTISNVQQWVRYRAK